MNERPILFSGEMVRAILEGRKTQTRRPIRPQPLGSFSKRLNCPCGESGDRLWVREAWAVDTSYDNLPPRMIPQRGLPVFYHATAQGKDHKWRPSLHMPRWASRIVLEITDIRVERVQNINEVSAKAEGMTGECPIGSIPAYETGPLTYHFAQTWDALYAQCGLGWEANPWVWVIEFKHLEELCPKN